MQLGLMHRQRRHKASSVLTPQQLRAARALVGWSREDLAKKAGISPATVRGFELLAADSKHSTILRMRRALEIAGVEFIDDDGSKGPGARLVKSGRDTKRRSP